MNNPSTSSFELEEPSYISVRDLLDLVRRRYVQFCVPALLVFVIVFVYVSKLPPIYRAVATISVESQQIPTDLIQSTITRYTDQQIEFVGQRVLTRQNLRRLIADHNLYQAENLDLLATEARFLADLEISVSNSSSGRQSTRGPALSFDIAFLSRQPEVSRAVVSDLVDLYLNENVRSRSERAAETTNFLASEAEKIRAEMIALEQQIAQFKLENRDSMPNVTDLNRSQLDRLDSDYSDISQRMEGIRGQLEVLRLDLRQYEANLISSAGSSGASSLADLQRRYDEFLIEHTEQHPDAVRMRQQLNNMRSRLADRSVEANEELFRNDATYLSYRTRIESLSRELEYLSLSRDELSSRMEMLAERIRSAPEIEKQFTDLERDLGNLRDNYEELKNKELDAQIAQNLEEGLKGERFKLLEPPTTPTVPHKPDRTKLLLAGTVFSGLVGGILVLLLEFSGSGLRGTALRNALGGVPLVTVPVIVTASETSKANLTLIFLVVFGVLSISVIVFFGIKAPGGW